jgi:putative ABC transport system permease protein
VIGTLARKSLRARLGRNIFIGLAILLGVSFVSGSFVLADSMKATFDNLFTQLNANVDLVVRTQLVGVDETEAVRDPLPADIVDQVAGIDGVAVAEGDLNRYAQLLDRDGEELATNGAPAIGSTWYPDSGIGGIVLKDGRPPTGPDEVAIDKASAERADYGVGDTVSIVFDSGQREFTIAGLIGLENADGFGGAMVSVFDPAHAAEILGTDGTFDAVNVGIEDGADLETVQRAIAESLPPRVEVVTGEQVAEETADAIGVFIDAIKTGLLIFAFVTAFVSAFIINNIFGITIGQRLRELALLRSIGANSTQVRRLIVIEALVVSVTATIIGVLAGLLVARGIIGIFSAAGAGFPSIPLKMMPRTVLVAAIVGIGVTLASVVFPAIRASRIPPVAAMRPELGFTALGASRRLIGGVVMTVVGAIAFVVGLFAPPDGAIWLIVLIGGGALITFLGVTVLSTAIAGPISRAIGAPIERLFGTSGKFARDNAARSPRRTARTASALMIGVSLISAAAVFAYSLRDTFTRILDQAITADYIVTDESFLGLPPGVANQLADLPELGAVSPFRFIAGSIDDEQIQVTAIDPVAFPDLVNLDVTEGGFEGLASDDGVTDGVMVYTDEADDLGVSVGDTVDVTFQNGVEGTLTVSGTFDDNSLGGQWYISLAQLEQITDQAPRDQFVLARLADGTDLESARDAVEAAVADFPQANVQDNSEFRQTQEDQINQLLILIVALLSMAIAISFLGIAITLALSVFERTREIGLLRAVGMTRRQLRRAVRWEAIIVALFGVVVGVAVGTLMGTALSLAVPDNVIDGVTMPWVVLTFVVFFAVVAATVAALYPAFKASRMNVLDAIAND